MSWVTRWKDEIEETPTLPGVYRRKAGGFRIRGRTTDPRTGKLREICRAVTAESAEGAARILAADLAAIRARDTRPASSPIDEYVHALWLEFLADHHPDAVTRSRAARASMLATLKIEETRDPMNVVRDLYNETTEQAIRDGMAIGKWPTVVGGSESPF